MFGGNPLLRGWIVSPDSYWLLDDLLYGAVASLLGLRPAVLLLVPSLLWAAVVLLAWRVTSAGGARPGWGGAALLLILLVLPPLCYGDALRFIGDAPGHMMTLASGLLAMLLSARLVEDAAWSWPRALGVAVLILVCAGSDPLSLVITAAPLLLAAGLLAFDTVRRGRCLRLMLLVASAVVLGRALMAGVAALGGIVCLPAEDNFIDAGRLPFTLGLLAQDLLTLFGADFFGRPLGGGLHDGAVPCLLRLPLLLLSGAALAGDVVALWRGFLRPGAGSTDLSLLDATLPLAILLCCASVVFSAYTLDATSIRYVSPVLVFAAILLARRHGANPRLWPLYAAQLALALPMLLALPPGRTTGSNALVQARALIDGARSRGLTEGFAGYWDASILTVRSRGALAVRPVVRGGPCGVQRFRWLSSAAWYKPVAARVFFIVDPALANFLTADDVTRVLGRPTETYAVGSLTIDVYTAEQLDMACGGHL